MMKEELMSGQIDENLMQSNQQRRDLLSKVFFGGGGGKKEGDGGIMGRRYSRERGKV